MFDFTASTYVPTVWKGCRLDFGPGFGIRIDLPADAPPMLTRTWLDYAHQGMSGRTTSCSDEFSGILGMECSLSSGIYAIIAPLLSVVALVCTSLAPQPQT